MKILFVFYDNQSRDNILPVGATYVAAYLREHGYKDITYLSQDVYHYSEDYIHEYLKKNHFDIVGMGFVAGYYQHKKIKNICDAITSLKDKPFIVLGGHGPSPVPEFYIRYTGADAVVIGEGEVPFLNLVKALENDMSLHTVRGIAFRDGDTIVTNERETPIANLDTIPFPYYEPLAMEYYIKSSYLTDSTDRGIVLCASRGCTHKCNFCMRMESGIRLRSVDNVVEEIKKYKKDYHINFVWFLDELFMVSERRTTEVCERFLEENLNIKYFCTGRLDIATPKLLKLMKQSGCVSIAYGIEQYDDEALEKMNKRLTTMEIERGIKMTIEQGVRPLFNIIFGNIGDTPDTLKKSVEFLHKYNDYTELRVLRPVTPYPGSPLYDLAIQKGMLKGPEDFYEKHKNLELLTVNFTNIPDDEFYRLMIDANTEIINKYYDNLKDTMLEDFKKVYSEEDRGYRGARH